MENEYQNLSHPSMTNQLITLENSERIKSFFLSLERLSLSLEHLFANRKPVLNGECYYTDEELSEKLKLSRRSLQDYRNEGRIPYIKLGGKILYRSSDIEKMLEEGYRGKFRQAFPAVSLCISSIQYGRIAQHVHQNLLSGGLCRHFPHHIFPEQFSMMRFNPERQCRDHLQTVLIHGTAVSIAEGTADSGFTQHSRFQY
jgi:hypothetical protein